MAGNEKQYMNVDACARNTEALLESQRELLSKMDGIEKRLFRDNGSVSMQTRLDRHEQTLKLLLWGVGIIGSTLLTGFVGGVILLIRETFSKVV